MPYEFKFYAGNRVLFSCDLKCQRCEGTTNAGRRCTRTTCIGTPLCWTHLLSENHLKVQRSTIAGAGKGLFAVHPRSSNPNTILFKRGEVIVEYDGELISVGELNRRYDEPNADHVAPYAYHQVGQLVLDAACKRSIGSLINHNVSRTRKNAMFDYDARRKKVYVVATKGIHNGDEIFLDYGEEYELGEAGVRQTTTYRASPRTRPRRYGAR
jgi:hypothetical protein